MFLYSAKYGLTTLNEILDVFGADQAIGYDIGCSHKVTIAASSLSEKARILLLQLVVDAFHGHAHNRLCQLLNHLLFLKGFGLEDLATCERIFAGTNPATRLIQHASYFHWVQFIDLQLDQWDKDKYLELSKCSNVLATLLLIKLHR
jgi:Kyakuja-Dileera-Zisupton transposase